MAKARTVEHVLKGLRQSAESEPGCREGRIRILESRPGVRKAICLAPSVVIGNGTEITRLNGCFEHCQHIKNHW